MDVVHATGLFVDHGGACPGQVSQFADWLRGNERGPQQPVRGQLCQPRGVGDIGLSAGKLRAALALASITCRMSSNRSRTASSNWRSIP